MPEDSQGAMPAMRTDDSDRAVSEVLGYSLIFGLIVTSIGIVTVGGLGTLEDARTNEQVSNADRAYDVLHDNLKDVHAEGAPSRSTEISLGESQLFHGDNITMEVEIDGDGEPPIVYDDIRPIVFRIEGDRRLVYEAGATMHVERDGGIVRNEPPFTLTEDGTPDRGSVHIPIVRTTAAHVESIGSTNVLVHAQSADRRVLRTNRAGGLEIDYIEITSPRYEIWANYFEDSDYCDWDPATDIDDAAETATCDVHGDFRDPEYLYVTHQQIRVDLIN